MIRIATLDDFYEVLTMTYAFAKETYPELAIDYEDVSTFIKYLLSDNRKSIVLLLEKDNLVVGMIAGTLIKALFNKEMILQEAAWWVNPDHRNTKEALSLPQALEVWGKKVGASWSQLCTAEGDYSPRVGKYYKRLGYKAFEHTYLKRI